MAKGIRRRELKEPDEFLTITGRVLDYAKEHEREITFAALGLALLMVLALGVRWYRGWQQDKAEAAFGAARRDFAAQKFDTAATGFERVSHEWPNTSFGPLALVYLGNSYAELDKRKEAEQAFRDALGASRDPLIRQIAEYNLGLLANKTGDQKAAVEALGKAVEIEGPLRAPAWLARLGSHQQFVENVSEGMQAINELSPGAREYVEAQIASQAKSGGGK
jgi:tetratricopeptide (TPR) repeat protein